MIFVVFFTLLLALVFDYTNGFHDAANSIATVVSTRVLSPKLAVIWASFFNFVAAFGFGVNVATTIGKGIIIPGVVTEYVILAGLVGAITWNIFTWYYGIPSSSSHALIGGFVGAAITKGGLGVLIWNGLSKILLFIVLSPIIGMLLGMSFMVAMYWIFQRSSPWGVDKYFRKLQLVSAGLYSLGHGTNDAQKTMGIISILLFSAGFLGDTFYVPFWVVLLSHTAIALGTLAGGWRIVRTMGVRITKLKPVGGFCAETAGAITLIGAAWGGIPVSTTHTIAGAIMGVGSTTRLSAVRWGVAREIVLAWILTIPLSALIAGVTYFFIEHILALL